MYSCCPIFGNFQPAVRGTESTHRLPENDMAGSETVLVLGATGGIGGELARQLRDAGWTVRALWRGARQAAEVREGITWLRGDAMDRRDVLAAAKGCTVIVHAVNPPGYRRWSELVLAILDNTTARDNHQA